MRKRIPLTGAYNTRTSSVNALSSSSGIAGRGIAGIMVAGRTSPSSTKDVRFVNRHIITIPDEITGSKKVKCIKRPGFVEHNTPGAGEKGVAIKVWTGQGSGSKVITAFGATTSTIYDGTTSLGALSGKCSGITETVISGTPTLAISGADSTGWHYQPSGSLTQIVSANFPGVTRTLAGTFAHLDGYPFILDSTGRLYNGDLNSISAWTANSYITANSVPDIGVAAVRHRSSIIAFCKEHFDVFYNAGNSSGSPLQRADNLTQLIGCTTAGAITRVRDTVYWCGSTKQAVAGIYAYDNGQVTKVSTPEIDAQITLAGPANITMSSAGFAGRHAVIVKAASVTYVYLVEEKNWSEWTSSVPLWTHSDGVVTGSTLVTYFVTESNTDGKVYVFNPAAITYQDDGAAFSASIQTGRLDFGDFRYKFWGFLNLICDQEPSTASLSITPYDDDYTTPGTTRTVDLSSNGPRVRVGGRSRRRSWTFTDTVNAPMGIEAVELEFDMGDH